MRLWWQLIKVGICGAQNAKLNYQSPPVRQHPGRFERNAPGSAGTLNLCPIFDFAGLLVMNKYLEYGQEILWEMESAKNEIGIPSHLIVYSQGAARPVINLHTLTDLMSRKQLLIMREIIKRKLEETP